MFPEDDEDEQQQQQQQYIPPDDALRQQHLNSIMAPSDTEDETEEAASPLKPDNAQRMTSAERNYQRIASQAPNIKDYQPSIWRRVGAALAGAGAGWRNPAQGPQVAQSILRQPYDNAYQNWQNQMQQAGAGLKLDESVQNRLNAQQRAGAAQTSADARMRAAQATEEEREWQMTHKPPTPFEQYQSDPDAYTKFESAQHPKAPNTFQDELDAYNKDPEGYAKFKSAGQKPAETEDDREKLEGMRQQGAMNRAKFEQGSITARQKQAQPKTVPPEQQIAAEAIAKQQLLRAHPEYGSFIRSGQVITPDQLPKAGDDAKQSFWHLGPTSRITPAQESLARTQYQQFLSDLDKQKRQVMGQSSGNWNIEEQQ